MGIDKKVRLFNLLKTNNNLIVCTRKIITRSKGGSALEILIFIYFLFKRKRNKMVLKKRKITTKKGASLAILACLIEGRM